MNDQQPGSASQRAITSIAAVAVLLSQATTADAHVNRLVEQAKAASAVDQKPATVKQLVLKPGGRPGALLKGGRGHSSHQSHSSHYSGSSSPSSGGSSHSSHTSHYSGSSGGGSAPSYPRPTPTPTPPRSSSDQEPPRSSLQPATPTPPPRPAPAPVTPSQPATPPPMQPANADPQMPYRFRVYLIDGRIVECDVQRDGNDVLLVKRAGTIRVGVDDIRIISTISLPATQPATAPAAGR